MAPGIDIGGWDWDPGRVDESLAGVMREHLEGFEKVTVGEGEDAYTLIVKRKQLLLLSMLEAARGGNEEAVQLVRRNLFKLLL